MGSGDIAQFISLTIYAENLFCLLFMLLCYKYFLSFIIWPATILFFRLEPSCRSRTLSLQLKITSVVNMERQSFDKNNNNNMERQKEEEYLT